MTLTINYQAESIAFAGQTLFLNSNTGSIALPGGATATRPASGLVGGMLRYNSDTLAIELYNGTSWTAPGISNITGSSTANAIVKFSGTTGLVIQNSGCIIDSSNNLSASSFIPTAAPIPSNGLYLTNTNTPAMAANTLKAMEWTCPNSSVNYIQALGSITTVAVGLAANGSDTNVPIYLAAQGNSQAQLISNTKLAFAASCSSSSAVNYILATGSATGVTVGLTATGTDTDIDLTILGKGTGLAKTATAAPGTNSTAIATTAFVATSFAPLASPSLSGTPLAPTATAGTNTTQVATTAFVDATLLVNAPVQSSSKNLRCAWASTTTITIASDESIVENSTFYARRIRSASVTVNCATTGANGLDAGALANNTWYYGYLIYNPTTSTIAGLASTSSTSPTLPSGYTFKTGAITAFRTDGSATIIGFKQFNADYQYVVGSNLSVGRLMASGAAGSTSTPTWVAVSVSNFVPTTIASTIIIYLQQATNVVTAAPNNSYGSPASNNPPLMNAPGGNGISYGDFILESTNIYWASDSNGYLYCFGFKINL